MSNSPIILYEVEISPSAQEYHSEDDSHILRRLGESQNYKWAYYQNSIYKDKDTYRTDLAERNNLKLIYVSD
jgi:hypothetical protein